MREKIFKYVRKYYEDAGIAVTDTALFNGHIDWYIDNDMIAVTVDADDNITAIGMARPLDTPEAASSPFTIIENGEIILVDFVAGNSTSDIEYLFEQLQERYPNGKHIAFQRLLKGDGRVRLFNLNRIKSLLPFLGAAS